VGIASYITAYGRIRLYDLCKDIRSRGGHVYYRDTDSVITDFDINSDPELKHKWCWDGNGASLGSLKSERGYYDNGLSKYYSDFIGAGSKLYHLMDKPFFDSIVEQFAEISYYQDNIVVSSQRIHLNCEYEVIEAY